MAKRKRKTDGWRKANNGHSNVYREIWLSAALYLSFGGNAGIVSAGWRYMREYKKGDSNPMLEFGTQKTTLDEAKAHVVRNYDKLIANLDAEIKRREERKAAADARRKAKTLGEVLGKF